MSHDDRIVEAIKLLTPENLHYVAKLITLMRFRPGFSEALGQIVPCGTVVASLEQLEAADALVDKWLNDEGWAELLRPELESVGVLV